MKKFLLLLVFLIIGALAGGLAVWILGGQPGPGTKSSSPSPQATSARETIVKYVGPMHPQIVRDKPGQCPICGMDLVRKEIDAKTGEKITESPTKQGMTGSDAKGRGEILYWVAPMDPSYKRDKPGKSPMGMDLVPIYADEVAGKPGTVTIDPVMVHNMGVEIGRVIRTDLSRTFRTIGEIAYDERSVSHIHTRVEGWVDKLYLDAPGDRVAKGDPILRIYSPAIVTTQEEFLLALQRQKRSRDSKISGRGESNDLVRQSRERLSFYGISEKEIDKIAETGNYQPTILLRAPHSGVVTELGVREGMYVTPQKMLYTVADLSTVWVMAHIYAPQAFWAREGDRVTLTMPFHPGRKWQGLVDYVYPYMEPMTRTVRARLVFANKDGALKPEMFATALIHGAPRENVLAVPEQAVIRTGKRSVVVTALGEGRFRPVEVTIGIESDGLVEIRKGLVENQRIVTSGQFLIDAESNLQAGLQRMTAEEEEMKMDSPESVEDVHDGHDHTAAGEKPAGTMQGHDHSGHESQGAMQ